ncbi:MAG TPA: iron ABC transporter permease [Methanoregulaceae archaeon]|nr:MAG: iron ABC transporter permease [Methanolinea sp.]HON81500.1 iron ABC transporter permease [Methanoregulaceae archaeon]HPD10306.1 iron ABC transporter permease [Methanoregulaceae archaeon]HRT15464.1 iron ABC transporter permease [Methanoregulaceae archaeon]HRU30937.1 iron ABC transporter permease [Methanoregulaceae archaeon]
MNEWFKRREIFERIGDLDSEFFSEKKKILVLAALFIILSLSAGVAMVAGAYSISPHEVYVTILAHFTPFYDLSQISNLHNTIIWNIRLPRVLLAIFVGIALGVAGAVYQGVFRNPLVEPYILGASSGAAFGAALGIVFPMIFHSVQIPAFIFGATAVAGAYLLARVRGETPIVTLILSGVVIGSIFSAFVSILKYTATDTALREIVFWLMGGFYYATWKDVFTIGPVVLGSFLILWWLGWKLNILSMGDEEAKGLGINPERYKLVVISLATLITAFAVSLVGIIAWVGLMMPHAARMLLGPDNRYVIPCAAMMGGFYLILCDTLARTLTTSEIPVGIITSILGAPYLCYLLRNKGRVIFG